MSQAGLQARAGSPDPLGGRCKSPSGFHRRDRNKHPFRAPENVGLGVRGNRMYVRAGCAGQFSTYTPLAMYCTCTGVYARVSRRLDV
eukprot:scaffold67129_cov30-Phaeocystis_antarctica.AAC.2